MNNLKKNEDDTSSKYDSIKEIYCTREEYDRLVNNDEQDKDALYIITQE